MKYIKLYENRRDFVFDEQRYFPNTALVNGEDEPSYFTDVEEVVFELTVALPTEKVVTGQNYTLAVEYGGADVFSEATVTTTGDVTLNGTQFTANTDGDFSVTATYDDKTVTLNGTSKLMTAAPTITKYGVSACGIHMIDIVGNGTKRITIDGVESTSTVTTYRKPLYEGDTAHDTVITATAQEEGKWESDVVTATFSIPQAQTFTASLSDTTLEDGQTAQLTVMYGSDDVSVSSSVVTRASGDLLINVAPTFAAHYSTGSGSLEVWSTNPNLTPITINVTVAEAAPVSPNIVFADNDVKTILANAFGSNGEITEEQAAAVTTWFEGGYNNTSTNPFCKNANVDSFDEFAYFTGVTEIGVDAFQDCSNMTSITLPSSLTYIPDYAFTGCSSLESVTIPAAVTYIGYRAFRSCTSLESITIGAGVSSMSTGVFDGCRNLAYMSVDTNNSSFNDGNGSNVIIDGSGNLLYGGGACSAIPNTAYTIANNAFSGIHLLNNTITIPSSVTSIGNNAFQNCDELTSITIPNSVTSIGNSAFKGCDGLTSVTIGNSVETIGKYAFKQCSSLTSVTIPDSVTEIGEEAFYDNEGLTSVTIGNSVTSIGNNAFYACKGLTSVTIGNSVTTISGGAFQGCSSLTSVTIPASVTSIGNVAFGSCLGLTSVTCEATTPPTLNTNAFLATNGFTIFVPAASVDTYKAAEIWSNYADRIQAIGGGGDEPEPEPDNNIVFADPDVKSIVVNAYGSNGEITTAQAAAVKTWFSGTDPSYNPFFGNTNVDSFDEFAYFTGVTQIGNHAFESCSNLQSVTIPASVTSIGANAFSDCEKLASVTIPNSVTSIGNYAFSNGNKLQSIICEATTPPTLGDYVFDSTNNCYIYVPAASLNTFKTAWSNYTDRIRAFGVYVSLSGESIVTGETYTLKVTHNGVDVLSNATITSTGDVTISGSSFTANSDGAFSITATYNGYTATLNGTASTYEPNPEYATAVLDCSDLEDANPLQTCANFDPEGEVPEGLNTLDCNFDGEVSYVENGVITIPTSGWLGSVAVDTADIMENSKVIDYIKLTHPSAEYKLNADTEVGDPLSFTCDVSFNSTTLTTTIYNFVSLEKFAFDGSTLQLSNLGSTDIKITRIEVCYLPNIEEEPAEEEE